jgi:hypothetical protein
MVVLTVLALQGVLLQFQQPDLISHNPVAFLETLIIMAALAVTDFELFRT